MGPEISETNQRSPGWNLKRNSVSSNFERIFHDIHLIFFNSR